MSHDEDHTESDTDKETTDVLFVTNKITRLCSGGRAGRPIIGRSVLPWMPYTTDVILYHY